MMYNNKNRQCLKINQRIGFDNREAQKKQKELYNNNNNSLTIKTIKTSSTV